MTDKNIEAIVHELADKEAIRDLARRYADCIWRRDSAGAIDLFTDDGEMDSGMAPPIKGREALLEAYERMIGDADFQPFVHNHVIELDGDRASGRCYLDLRASNNGTSMIGSGYYEDRYARIGGAWKFKARKLVLRFFVPLKDGWAESSTES